MLNPSTEKIPQSQRLALTLFLSGLLVGLGGFYAPVQAQLVEKTAEPFESAGWKIDGDSSAAGGAKISTEVPAELAPDSKSSVDFEANFSGKGFEFFTGVPNQPLVIPGVTKKLSVWVRNPNKSWWLIHLRDGWGRLQEWRVSDNTDGNWKKVSFNVPADWVQPISIGGVFTHNWDSKTTKETRRISLDQLEAQTDISDVDPETGALKTWVAPSAAADPEKKLYKTSPLAPLLKVNFAATQPHNVFAGVRPQFALTAQNWRPQTAAGTVDWKVLDARDNIIKSGKQTIQVDDNVALSLPMETANYGVYHLDSTISWTGGKSVTSSQPFAVIPQPRPLTEAEKDASPYGLNVHSGSNVMVDEFRKAGIVWFRDYGFDYEWVVRAKGADKSYSGWPYYPKTVGKYDAYGARVLAIMKGAIKPPTAGVSPEPDPAWTREIAQLQITFPSLKYIEMDNEYDLGGNNSKLETATDWKNYRNYHKKLGEITHMLGDSKTLAVENGRAGIWPELVRRTVQSGDFAQIDVINSHHYTGTDSPELNIGNHNMGFEGDETMMTFFDQLREVKKSASADNRPRQHWLTEFGWDTKAGPVVSAREQAAYLSRAFMLLVASGTEKGFWFFDKDAPKSTQFFDGCGLFTSDELPKLSYASYAGLTQILPKPEYLGMISAGENTWGYLFRNEGKLVAALWTLKDEKGPAVNFENATVYDYLANPTGKTTATLGLEPTFAVGVSEDSKWFRQSAYSLNTHLLSLATAGDSITAQLQVKNSRKTAINGKASLQLPAGWSDVSGEKAIVVEPGQTKVFPLIFKVATNEVLGEKMVRLAINEGELLKTIPLRVQIKNPVNLSVKALKGEPGSGDVSIRISNSSAQNLDGNLSLKLPTSWNTTTPEIKVDALKPMEVRDIHAKVQWTPAWKEGESATVEYKSVDGRTAQQPLIPSRLSIYKAPNITIDGDLKDWPVKNKLPEWVMGSTHGKANAALYMAWSSQGLHLALNVRDSKATVPDPKSFWDGDVLELFVDTRDKKTARKFEAGDHQFWVAPLIAQKRGYVGQWKRGEEIPTTKYDILPAAQSVAVKTADGYIIECLLPASQIKDFKANAGSKLGLNLNLTVKGLTDDRQVFWSVPKSEGVEQPAEWGTVTLAE